MRRKKDGGGFREINGDNSPLGKRKKNDCRKDEEEEMKRNDEKPKRMIRSWKPSLM